MRLNAAAAGLAERQLGLVARRQLVGAHGIPETTVDDAVAGGRLVTVRRGVYRVAGAPGSPEQRLRALVLAGGDGALLSHRSAAWLWDLLPPPERHELSVPHPGRPRNTGALVHRSADLHLAIPGSVRGVPVTGVGRTILDCAADPTVDLELLIDAARRVHGISRTLLPATVAAHARRGRPGVGRLRGFVVDVEIPHSDFERLVARWLTDQGVTGWRMHHRIVVPGRGPVEMDFAWPECEVALELEGCDHRLRAALHDDDTDRQNWITLAGYTILRTTYRRWVSQTAQVLAQIEAALAGAEPRAVTPATSWAEPTERGSTVPWA